VKIEADVLSLNEETFIRLHEIYLNTKIKVLGA